MCRVKKPLRQQPLQAGKELNLTLWAWGCHRRSPVLGPCRDNPADAASGVGNIPGVPRNDVDVGVADRLPGPGSVVHADVKRRRLEFLREPFAQLGDLRPQFLIFTLRQVEQRGRMPLGNDQRVAGSDRESVEERDEGVRRCQNALWRQRLAKGAVGPVHLPEDAKTPRFPAAKSGGI